jgi:hypothetical protein
MIVKETMALGDGNAVTVRELTVGEMRQWLAKIEEGVKEPDLLGETLFEDISLSDIELMSDLSSEQIDALSQSDLRAIADLVKKVNPSFFGMRVRIKGLSTMAGSQAQQ